MDDQARENAWNLAKVVAQWELYKFNVDHPDHKISPTLVESAMEGAHTQYAVTQHTGDARLGRRVGVSADLRTQAMWWLALGAPVAVFLGVCALGENLDPN